MVERNQLDAFIRSSVDYLVRTCSPDGPFLYRVNLDPEVRRPRRNNILRHAGAIYSLGMADRDEPSVSARAAMIRAARFLHAQIARPPEWPETYAVWSRPEIEGRANAVLEAKLGGTGLGLVALLEVERISPGLTPPFVLRSLGEFICKMQHEDGGFYSMYVPTMGGPRTDWVSLYYPGEAALGLLKLHAFDGDPIWLETAEKALLYLAASRIGQDEVEPDHWALLATADWSDGPGRLASQEKREAILGHASQVVRSMLQRIPDRNPESALAGCVTRDGRTCPTATQLEGMQAAVGCSEDWETSMRDHSAEAIQQGVGFLLRSQVTDGPHRGGMPRSHSPEFSEGRWMPGAADPRPSEIRVDYVQHALSAVIQYRRQLLCAA
jgi:hypothetical protein